MVEKTVNHGSDIPLVLISIMLVTLPVKTLLRFRCVCKQWYTLIHDPTFISNHNIAHKNNDTIKYLIHRIKSKHSFSPHGKCLFRWHKVLGAESDIRDMVHDWRRYLPASTDMVHDFKFPSEPYDLEFHGSCNGLVCLSVTNTNVGNNVSKLYLYNPSIRKCKMIDSGKNYIKFRDDIIGFGLCKSANNVDDDYKIVKISTSTGGKVNDLGCKRMFLYVYTFSTSSWKRIDVAVEPSVFFKWRSSKTVDGVMHWLGKPNEEYVIVSFDLRREILGELPLPSKVKLGAGLCFGNLSESLCLLSYGGSGIWSIWRRKENSSVDCWTVIKIMHIGYSLIPRFLGNQGFMLDSIEGYFSMFDLRNEKWIRIERNWSYCYRATDYSESLVLL